jgi:hypothetical protein
MKTKTFTLISFIIKSWCAGERTGKPFALDVKIFVGNITARTGSPNHRFWACSLGTSTDNSNTIQRIILKSILK